MIYDVKNYLDSLDFVSLLDGKMVVPSHSQATTNIKSVVEFNRKTMYEIMDVFLELKRRGYKVEIGKIDSLEIDFIATNADEKKYYQVSASVLDQSTFEREVSPLLKINDNYEKIILTLDELPMNYEGIRQVNIIDWLLDC